MDVDDIRRVLVVGAGTMGYQIGLQCATHGLGVTLYDVSEDGLAAARRRIEKQLGRWVRSGLMGEDGAAAVRGRMTLTTDLAGAAEADLVCEAVYEDPALKGRVFADLDARCPERTVFTTNTSTLLPSAIAEATGRPERFCALHFHLPVWSANVVDVMAHPGTDPAITALVRDFAVRIGQIPIVLKKEQPGYVYNTMLAALSEAAQTLLTKDVVDPWDIDRAWMGIMHTPIGPLGILDAVGLDTAWRIERYHAEASGDPQQLANAELLKRMVDAGKLGVKSGEGFYTYPDPAFARPGFLEGD